MNEVIKLHNEAMGLAEEASLEKLKGNLSLSEELIKKAFEKERDAANSLLSNIDLEPTRSVLFRSAASLAIECKEIRAAEKLIATALSGNPPEEIASELRDLLEDVYFRRHLDLRGIVLEPNEFQVSITGDAIGFGVAESNTFIGRVRDLGNLIFRTAERKKDKKFRERIRRDISKAKEVEVYISVPRAASFAVTFRIGYSQQLELPGFGFSEMVINELMDCIDLFNKSEEASLRNRIPDSAYYRNFISLAKRISPDGKLVKSIGFTSTHTGKERHVLFTRKQIEIPPLILEEIREKLKETVRVKGVLKYADSIDALKNEIRLIDEKGTHHRIRVPEGMMDDIVRPLWDYYVEVIGFRENKFILLEEIRKVEEES